MDERSVDQGPVCGFISMPLRLAIAKLRFELQPPRLQGSLFCAQALVGVQRGLDLAGLRHRIARPGPAFGAGEAGEAGVGVEDEGGNGVKLLMPSFLIVAPRAAELESLCE